MDKENSKSAARLRRSAIAERIRLREEWSALKGIEESPNPTVTKATKSAHKKQAPKPREHRNVQAISEALRGVVALVEVGAESRALALRAGLTALGATVVPSWSPLVTHLVWSQGGCRAIRAKARALACRLVSPLWVEACAASARRLPERTFPAAARASDLPSPATLRRLLKKAEHENIPLVDLLEDNDKATENAEKCPRLRISSENERDTTTTTDTSHETTDMECRVNTGPRRGRLPPTAPTPLPAKSRRKLFTQKEAELMEQSSDDADADPKPTASKTFKGAQMTQQSRRDLARANRAARRLMNSMRTQLEPVQSGQPRIVLTGMTRSERSTVHSAIRALNGRVQCRVDKSTTHVLLGSCHEQLTDNGPEPTAVGTRATPRNATQVTANEILTNSREITTTTDLNMRIIVIPKSVSKKSRTLNALLGAVRGCRVLHAQWAIDSFNANKWLHHLEYEVLHLKKVSQKARVERRALGRTRAEYAYDVFSGMRVRLMSSAAQRDAAKQLLTLCGAIVVEERQYSTGNGLILRYNCKNVQSQNGGQRYDTLTQNGGRAQDGDAQTDYDLTVGSGDDEVNSKWVFDSVVAGRMRTVRKYVNNVYILSTQRTEK